MTATDGAPGAGPEVDNDARLGEFVDRETLRFVRDIPHPPAFVWSVLVDADQYQAWLWPCSRFEARLGGRFEFDVGGKPLAGAITAFAPPRRLNLADRFIFELFARGAGTRLVVTLKRPTLGWSVMAIAGFHGWLGRLTRLLDRTPQAQTEAWAARIWASVFPAYELAVRRSVAGGAKPIWRLHFAPGEAALTAEAQSQLIDLARLLAERGDLALTIDGFGDDPCDVQASLALCQARVDTARAGLIALGVASVRLHTGYVLGNYHYLAERESEAGRAFNRRIELRPSY